MSRVEARAAVPYIVVAERGVMEEAVAELRGAGWRVVAGWHVPSGTERVICAGQVDSAGDASAAMLAAVAGHGLVIEARADRHVIDRLCDDLRRLGRLDHRDGDKTHPSLSVDEHMLLDRLLSGQTLGEAAADLNLSRRTADRRLASARRTLGTGSTAQALTAFARISPHGNPPRG